MLGTPTPQPAPILLTYTPVTVTLTPGPAGPYDAYFSMGTAPPSTPAAARYDAFLAAKGSGSTWSATAIKGGYMQVKIQDGLLKSMEVMDWLYLGPGSPPQVWAIYTPTTGVMVYAPASLGLAAQSQTFLLGPFTNVSSASPPAVQPPGTLTYTVH
jgi:hypothetical protein